MSYINQGIILQCGPPSGTLPKRAFLSPSVWVRREYIEGRCKREKKSVQTHKRDICQKVFNRSGRLKASVETHNKVPLVCNKCYREFVRKDHFDRHINCCDEVLPSFLSYDEFASPSDQQTDNVPSMSDQEVDDHEAVRRENDVSSMSDQAVPELFYDNIESDEEVDNTDVPVLPVTIDSPTAKEK